MYMSTRVRWSRLILLCLLVLSFLAGCGQETTSTAGTTPVPAAITAAPAQATASTDAETTSAPAATEPSGATSMPAATEPPVATEATEAVATITSETPAAETSGTAAAETPPATTTGAAEGAAAGDASFQNPVLRSDFADPFVLVDDGEYYAYATNAIGKNIQVARSTDLVKWQVLNDALPALPGWAKLGGSLVWAPEVAKIGDTYLMYYTARDKESDRQCVGVATSDKPEGRFRDTNDKPFVCQAQEGGTIDASPFFDEGKWYLLFKNDGNCCSIPTHLYVQEMAPDGLSLLGEPTRLVRNDKAWEGRVVEAPTMWKHEGKYYLFFSANDYAGPPYAVGYATCETAMGPCQDAPENPILKSTRTKPPVIGPGHQTIILDDDGDTWLVYHAWEVLSSGTRGGRRFMWIDELVWEDGKPVLKGPTTDPQPMP